MDFGGPFVGSVAREDIKKMKSIKIGGYPNKQVGSLKFR
jgi:hypothetical protein